MKQENDKNIAQRKEAQRILKKIGMKGVAYAALFGHNENFITDIKRKGMTKGTEMTLRMLEAMHDKGVLNDVLEQDLHQY